MKRLTGFKQTKYALEHGTAKLVYIACDADEQMKAPILALCRQNGVMIKEVESKKKLGELCRIDISAAVACDVGDNNI